MRKIEAPDLAEVGRFCQYLIDRREMPYEPFMRKYQAYLRLTDKEVQEGIQHGNR